MIQRFNRVQTLSGIAQFVGGTLLLTVVWIAFRIAGQILHTFTDSEGPRKFAAFVPALLLGLGGWRWWKGGERFRVFKDSAFHTALLQQRGQDDSIIVTGPGEHSIDGFRDFFAHIFLLGPWLVFNGVTMVLSRLPVLGDLEERMERMLQRLRLSGKWESAEHYSDYAEEVGALIRCSLVDFSPSKFILRAADGKNPPPESEV